MTDFNAEHNRTVWVDIPVAELGRAVAFYRAVLGCEVVEESFENFDFAVIAHDRGNGGCLVPKPDDVSSTQGILVYMNADGRIRDAVAQTKAHGGEVVTDVHAIGPHGYRAIVQDSEGNRLALHSRVDA